MIGENLRRSSRSSIEVLPGNLPEVTEERLEKHQAEIGANYFPNTSILERYRYTCPYLPPGYGRFSSRPYFPWDTADLLLSLIFPRDIADFLLAPISLGIRPICFSA
jgi:hypothetical protein